MAHIPEELAIAAQKYAESFSVAQCSGDVTAKIKSCFLIEWKYKKDKRHHDKLSLAYQGEFMMKCLNEGRIILHKVE